MYLGLLPFYYLQVILLRWGQDSWLPLATLTPERLVKEPKKEKTLTEPIYFSCNLTVDLLSLSGASSNVVNTIFSSSGQGMYQGQVFYVVFVLYITHRTPSILTRQR